MLFIYVPFKTVKRNQLYTRFVVYIYRFSEVHFIYLLFYDLRMQSLASRKIVTGCYSFMFLYAREKSKYLFLADF